MQERKPIGLSVPYRKVTPSHTQDEIIEMARQAGIKYRHMSDEFYTEHNDGVAVDQMQAFAKLVIERHHAKTKQVQTKKESA